MFKNSGNTNILALHGFTGCGEDFDALFAHCPGAFRRHCPDLPGHGKNFALPASLDAHLDFIENERRKIFGAAPCVLLGYSMGGRIALHYALRMPEKISALVLISASPGIAENAEREKRRQSDDALAEKILAGGIPEFLSFWENLPLFAGMKNLPPAQRDALRQRRLKNNAAGLAASLHGVGTGALPPLWDKIKFWQKPVAILAGENDAKFAAIARAMCAGDGFPNPEKIIIPATGHVAHLESPAETAKALCRVPFL